MRFSRVVTFALLVLLVGAVLASAEECRLMRYPDIHKDNVVFTYAGDLWLVSSEGGMARRLTSHEGVERYARFSPDGKHIAFTGQYEGNAHVYVIPTEGGEPRRLTFHPSADMVLGWTPDGKRVLFRSGRYAHAAAGSRLYTVSVDGGPPEALAIPESGLASFSPDGKKLAYNRRFRETRTWKRYTGGTAQDVWIYDLENNTVKQITDWKGTDNSPMWGEGKIYFNSDRDHTLNLFAYDVASGETVKVTNHDEYDVKWPGMGPGAIVYENGGYLQVLDLGTLKSRRISVEVASDLTLTRPTYEKVSDLIRTFNLSPGGKRAVFGARGDIFTVPEEKGDTRNITRTQGIREIMPAWSPDGKWIAYFSDRSGEYELYVRAQDGSDEEQRITTDGECYRYSLGWSPDSEKLFFTDKKYRLYYVDIDKKKPVLVDQSEISRINHAAWSPDSKWLTYTKNAPHYFEAIYLYSLDDNKSYKITGDFNDDVNPVFDPDGKYLYFISVRSFSPTFSDMEREYVYNNTRKLYLMTLQADTPSPFAPESDEVEIKEDDDDDGKDEGEDTDKKDDEESDDKDDDEKDAETKIDLKGIERRLVAFPVEPGNYGGLVAASGKVFYLSYPSGGNGKRSLMMYDIEDRKEETVLTGLSSYDISPDGKKIIYSANGTYGIIDAAGKKNSVGDGKLDLAGLEMKVDPRAEWKQIFDEAWRIERDFFYDPNMHGVDWPGMKKRYGQLLPYVAHRSDLNYLLGEMIGELATSHSYVGGGKSPKVKSVGVGLLGADYVLEPGSDFYRIKKIYWGESGAKGRRSPLAEPGVEINEGDYVIAINDNEIRPPANIYAAFEMTAGKQITVKVNDKPQSDGASEYTVTPVSSESGLRYLDWVETNRRIVDEASGGRVGYIHVPNTSVSGLNEFSRAFFAQVRKDGLIVDVRYNAGGMIPEMFIERLNRPLLSLWAPREGKLTKTPSAAVHGPMVCITNEFAGSGGDALPYYFREVGLGPLIGTRTWGGLVGISGGIPLIDGGYLSAPTFAFINLEGEWDVENFGVAPDIEVDNRPDLVASGQDPQLERAIKEVIDRLEQHPPVLPPRPPYPIKK